MSAATAARAGCRDCATGNLGGPAENRFTVFDAICPACRDAGQPQVFVNTATLNVYVRDIDLGFGGPPPGFSLERSYNSEDRRPGPFGNGWTSNVGDSLSQQRDGSWLLRRGSGRTDRFAAPIEPGKPFVPITQTSDVLTRSADGGFALQSALSPTVRVFHSSGRLLAIREGAAARVSLEYDATGRLTRARVNGRNVRFEYGGDGRVASLTDNAGRSVRFTYDGEGNLIQQIRGDGQTISYAYANGLLVSIGAPGGQTDIEYDPELAGAASVSLPDGATRQYGPLRPRVTQLVDGSGNATTYGSTVLGLTEFILDATGNRTTYSYDTAGRRIQTTNANGDAARFTYDESGNLLTVTDAAGNRWSADYSAGNLIRVTDARRNVYQFTYDASGNLQQVIDPQAGRTSVTRNAAGLIAAIMDAKGNQNRFQYDSDGLLTQRTDALSGNWRYQYDPAAQVSARVDPNGNRLEAEYDSANRLAAVSSGDARIAFDYGSLVRDAQNRVIASTDFSGNQVSYSYGPNGRLAAITLPGGSTISYEYDAAGRLARVADWLGNFALYRYEATGLVASVNVSGGPVTIYQYDAARNLRATVTTGTDGAALAGYRYTVDANGNRVSASALEPFPGDLGLTTATLFYDAANQLTARADGQTYRYDAGGNLTRIEGARSASLAYDAFGRLQSFDSDISTQYAYDGLGLLAERTRNGEARRYVYDLSGARPRIVMETDGSGAPVSYYVHGLGLLWKTAASSGKTWFYHFDGDGNVLALSDPAAGVVNRYRYDAFGTLAAFEEAVENPFRSRGQAGWIDDGNGLLYGDGGFYAPEVRRTLRGSVTLDPPYPVLAPQLAGAGACFTLGVAECSLGAGRREPR